MGVAVGIGVEVGDGTVGFLIGVGVGFGVAVGDGIVFGIRTGVGVTFGSKVCCWFEPDKSTVIYPLFNPATTIIMTEIIINGICETLAC